MEYVVDFTLICMGLGSLFAGAALMIIVLKETVWR